MRKHSLSFLLAVVACTGCTMMGGPDAALTNAVRSSVPIARSVLAEVFDITVVDGSFLLLGSRRDATGVQQYVVRLSRSGQTLSTQRVAPDTLASSLLPFDAGFAVSLLSLGTPENEGAQSYRLVTAESNGLVPVAGLTPLPASSRVVVEQVFQSGPRWFASFMGYTEAQQVEFEIKNAATNAVVFSQQTSPSVIDWASGPLLETDETTLFAAYSTSQLETGVLKSHAYMLRTPVAAGSPAPLPQQVFETSAGELSLQQLRKANGWLYVTAHDGNGLAVRRVAEDSLGFDSSYGNGGTTDLAALAPPLRFFPSQAFVDEMGRTWACGQISNATEKPVGLGLWRFGEDGRPDTSFFAGKPYRLLTTLTRDCSALRVVADEALVLSREGVDPELNAPFEIFAVPSF